MSDSNIQHSSYTHFETTSQNAVTMNNWVQQRTLNKHTVLEIVCCKVTKMCRQYKCQCSLYVSHRCQNESKT